MNLKSLNGVAYAAFKFYFEEKCSALPEFLKGYPVDQVHDDIADACLLAIMRLQENHPIPSLNSLAVSAPSARPVARVLASMY